MAEEKSCCSPSRAKEAEALNRGSGPSAPGASATPPGSHPRELVELPGGRFLMGTDSDEGFPADGEGPVREVRLDAFAIDALAVSNDDFARFVEATGYVTEAERFGWSFVFHLFVSRTARKRGEVRAVPGLDWWLGVERACWKRPEGRGSNLKGRGDHPVVHVSYADAQAYCRWAGLRLPTEAEWEYAARGGLAQRRFAWGDELTPAGRHMANIWQGTFPTRNTEDDGWAGTAPVDAFAPNGFGLYNVAGNVWEWCADWFSPEWHVAERAETRENPRGPKQGERRVNRGGSYLCHHSYCNRYRVAARSSNTPDSSTGNLGFRVAR